MEQHGCKAYQGFLFSGLVPLEAFEQLLNQIHSYAKCNGGWHFELFSISNVCAIYIVLLHNEIIRLFYRQLLISCYICLNIFWKKWTKKALMLVSSNFSQNAIRRHLSFLSEELTFVHTVQKVRLFIVLDVQGQIGRKQPRWISYGRLQIKH